jgi:hypothetical protein
MQRVSALPLVIGYTAMAAALAITVVVSFALGSSRVSAPNTTGVYRVDPPAPCLPMAGVHARRLLSSR